MGLLKRLLSCIVVCSCVLLITCEIPASDTPASDTSSDSDEDNGDEGPQTYSLRDTGPAGGLIFYVNPNTNVDGWTYLEAAPQSTEWTGKQWADVLSFIDGADGYAIGTGEQNTSDIVADLGAGCCYAAQLCYELTYGGYDDWFLPSWEELNKMYINLHQHSVGGFTAAVYWSSSESNLFFARSQDFDDGSQAASFKTFSTRVRAARAF